ncbi:MAG: S-layer homology domain-containing protein [Firmicutes bacterium]|nr:S-layer homology domain-containing protein [Bacillota bacterium]
MILKLRRLILMCTAFAVSVSAFSLPVFAEAAVENSGVQSAVLSEDPSSQIDVLKDSADQPSPWAVEEVSRAIEKGLVPEWLQSDYAKPITRKELAELLSYYLLYKNENAVNFPTLWISLSTGRDVLYKENVFSDINDINLNWMYQLGCIKGYEDGTFRPDNNITRQEAAVMMHNVVRRYCYSGFMPGYVIYNASKRFKDFDDVAPWAQLQVGLLSSNVINGVEKGIFGPQYNITREQAISIILRIIEKY